MEIQTMRLRAIYTTEDLSSLALADVSKNLSNAEQYDCVPSVDEETGDIYVDLNPKPDMKSTNADTPAPKKATRKRRTAAKPEQAATNLDNAKPAPEDVAKPGVSVNARVAPDDRHLEALENTPVASKPDPLKEEPVEAGNVADGELFSAALAGGLESSDDDDEFSGGL